MLVTVSFLHLLKQRRVLKFLFLCHLHGLVHMLSLKIISMLSLKIISFKYVKFGVLGT